MSRPPGAPEVLGRTPHRRFRVAAAGPRSGVSGNSSATLFPRCPDGFPPGGDLEQPSCVVRSEFGIVRGPEFASISEYRWISNCIGEIDRHDSMVVSGMGGRIEFRCGPATISAVRFVTRPLGFMTIRGDRLCAGESDAVREPEFEMGGSGVGQAIRCRNCPNGALCVVMCRFG